MLISNVFKTSVIIYFIRIFMRILVSHNTTFIFMKNILAAKYISLEILQKALKFSIILEEKD